MFYEAAAYEIIVVGAGHAGCEAALAAARMGRRTLLCTLNIQDIALMPCNPSIGGPAKAQLVREIDALGGEMAVNIDSSNIQMRLINTGKGPAVQSLRAQADKEEYQSCMRQTIFRQENLDVVMCEIESLLMDDCTVQGAVTKTGAVYRASAVILTTGTFLKGRIITGDVIYDGGPGNQFPALKLSDNLRDLGLEIGRFKTGTPPRVDAQTVNFTLMTEQPGDQTPWRFSYISDKPARPQLSCWLTYSNPVTHQIVLDNLDRAPMFTGVIKGKGPRYCPSFEDKVVRFRHKDQHQLFVEPEGRHTPEMYIQGMNTSLPEDVQIRVLHSVPGLENARIMRTGYAIEYDYLLPHQLTRSLAVRSLTGLFTAGQINGTSGYEEAAAQGLIAGINAALFLEQREPFVLKRSEAYIGVLIDDLISRDLDEPYRLLTSRAEYRLLLRQDNADLRLTEKGRELGLVSDQRWEIFNHKKAQMNLLAQQLQQTGFSPSQPEIQSFLSKQQSAPLKERTSLWQLLRRPEISLEHYQQAGFIEKFPAAVQEEVSLNAKYEGYLNKQAELVQKFEKMENKNLPPDLDYDQVHGLSNEALQRLKLMRPESVGQASRLAGVNPADISILLIHLEKHRRSQLHMPAAGGHE